MKPSHRKLSCYKNPRPCFGTYLLASLILRFAGVLPKGEDKEVTSLWPCPKLLPFPLLHWQTRRAGGAASLSERGRFLRRAVFLETCLMKLIADALITLPFTLDFCAKGPDVAPLTCILNSMDATLFFPPSLSEGTDGQGIFGEWAWWTGSTLRLVLEMPIDGDEDTEDLRTAALATGQEILRRFLNAYRWRFSRPEVHPIALDPRVVSLSVQHDDGHLEALPEPLSSFFYQNMPAHPPLETSVNATTVEVLMADVQAGIAPPLAGQLRLDAEALEAQGETERAELVRGLIVHG